MRQRKHLTARQKLNEMHRLTISVRHFAISSPFDDEAASIKAVICAVNDLCCAGQ